MKIIVVLVIAVCLCACKEKAVDIEATDVDIETIAIAEEVDEEVVNTEIIAVVEEAECIPGKSSTEVGIRIDGGSTSGGIGIGTDGLGLAFGPFVVTDEKKPPQYTMVLSCEYGRKTLCASYAEILYERGIRKGDAVKVKCTIVYQIRDEGKKLINWYIEI